MNSHYRRVIVAAGAVMGCVAIGSIFSLPALPQPVSVATYVEGAIARGAPQASAYRGKRGVGTSSSPKHRFMSRRYPVASEVLKTSRPSVRLARWWRPAIRHKPRHTISAARRNSSSCPGRSERQR